MTDLHAALAPRVAEWRDAGYRHDDVPAIGEILSHALEGEPGDFPTPPETTRLRLVAAAARVGRIPILGACAATILPAALRGGPSS